MRLAASSNSEAAHLHIFSPQAKTNVQTNVRASELMCDCFLRTCFEASFCSFSANAAVDSLCRLRFSDWYLDW